MAIDSHGTRRLPRQRRRAAARRPRDLEDLVRIESVSADPERGRRGQRSAEAVPALFEAEGCTTRIASADGGAPAVIAHKAGPEGAPTVLLYAHHDVQPENDHADWDSAAVRADRARRPPLRPRRGRRQGRHRHPPRRAAGLRRGPAGQRGRSSSRARRRSAPRPCRRCWRSTSTTSRADVIVIADSGNWDIGVPALTTSLRGLVRVDVEVRTLTHAVHSGMWGGLVPDALMTLARLIATLHDDARQRRGRGAVRRPGGRRRVPRGAVAGRVRRRARHRMDRHRLHGRAAVDQARALDHRPRRAQGGRRQQHARARRPLPDLHAHRPGRQHRQRRRSASRPTSSSTSPGAPS